MELLRINHSRQPDSSTHRLKCDHEGTKDFKVINAGIEAGLKLEAICRGFTLKIEFSPAETRALIESLIKK
jgi:hypothetical protein